MPEPEEKPLSPSEKRAAMSMGLAILLIIAQIPLTLYLVDAVDPPFGYLLALLIGLLLWGGAITGAKAYEKRAVARERARQARRVLGQEIDVDAVLREPWDWEHLQGRVEKVVLMRNVQVSSSGEAGNSQKSLFASYLVTDDGETVDLEEGEQHVLEERAQKLASALDAKYVDTSYGTH